MITRLLSIAWKELLQLRRDRLTLAMMVVMVSGGIDPARIQLFKTRNAPVDAFGIGSAKNQFAQLCPKDCASTHSTRFKCYIYYAIVEVFTSEVICSRSNNLHFGMGCNII